MNKISTYGSKAPLALTDYVLGNDATGPTTKRFLLSDIVTLMLNNIPAAEGTFPFVSSGMVWSGDAYASTRAASMTSGRVKVNSTFLAISAVTARVFTASKDTYIDVLDSLGGSGTLVYTEVTNNAASPALAANSTRIAIIVTGASNIANVGSINQGQESKVLPIASSIPYAVTDSLGNLICPRDQTSKVLGHRQIITDFTTASATFVDVTGMNMIVNIPSGRKVRVGFNLPLYYVTAVATIQFTVIDVTAGAAVLNATTNPGNTIAQSVFDTHLITPPASGVRNYKLQMSTSSGTVHTQNSSVADASTLSLDIS